MQQLTGLDASFVYSESAHAPTHVTSILIYDQSTAPKGEVTFKGILDHIEQASASGEDVQTAARARAARSRPSVLDRG